MKWERKPPDRVGYWLRFNAGHSVQMRQVWDEPGVGLVVSWGWGGEEKEVPLDFPNLRGWLWYGPIPKPVGEPYVPETPETER